MKNSRLIILVLSVVLFSGSVTLGQQTDPKNQPEELGTVKWYRSYSTALQQSLKQNKPVLILFQEVPGCATCRNYGHDVLTNPLLVEAIENEFIPLAIYNNKGGDDRKVLNIYKEPSWNNPVVRIVDYDGVDIVDRLSSNYSATGLYDAMINALKKHKKPIPEYLNILGKELYGANFKKEAYFGMYCFWSGEMKLGSQVGILNTEAGFMNGREVVKVSYDANKTSEEELNSYASNNSMYTMEKSNSYRNSLKDEDYYLKKSNYRYLPLSQLQRTLINSTIGKRKDASLFLSPSQLKLLKQIKSLKQKEVLYHMPIKDLWAMAF